jgi:hypothetical protein
MGSCEGPRFSPGTGALSRSAGRPSLTGHPGVHRVRPAHITRRLEQCLPKVPFHYSYFPAIKRSVNLRPDTNSDRADLCLNRACTCLCVCECCCTRFLGACVWWHRASGEKQQCFSSLPLQIERTGPSPSPFTCKVGIGRLH